MDILPLISHDGRAVLVATACLHGDYTVLMSRHPDGSSGIPVARNNLSNYFFRFFHASKQSAARPHSELPHLAINKERVIFSDDPLFSYLAVTLLRFLFPLTAALLPINLLPGFLHNVGFSGVLVIGRSLYNLVESPVAAADIRESCACSAINRAAVRNTAQHAVDNLRSL